MCKSNNVEIKFNISIFFFDFFLRLWNDILNGIEITGIKQINIMIIFFQLYEIILTDLESFSFRDEE